MHTGIDVSRFQGQPDFDKVEASGRRFVYVKATEGADFVDTGHKARHAAARDAGLHAGFYHFLRPRTDRSGGVEAEHFWRNVNGVEGGENGAELLRLAADIETRQDGMSNAAVLRYSTQFLTRLEALAGHEPILYTFPSFIADWGAGFADYRLWIAHPGVSRPTLPKPWKDWTVWQDNFNGRVPGVAGDCDTDRCPVLAELILERNEY
jgi:lysozyme